MTDSTKLPAAPGGRADVPSKPATLRIVGGSDFSSPAYPPPWSPLDARPDPLAMLAEAEQLQIEAADQLETDICLLIGFLLLVILGCVAVVYHG